MTAARTGAGPGVLTREVTTVLAIGFGCAMRGVGPEIGGFGEVAAGLRCNTRGVGWGR